MKAPLQALLIAPDSRMRQNILNGKKKISLREGYRDYRPGPLMLCCHLEPWAVQATITEVRHCALSRVTAEELAADGFSNLADAISGLRRFYPKIAEDSPMTVIHWDDVQGKLIDAESKKLSGPGRCIP